MDTKKAHGVQALNREYIDYEQVDKRQAYRFAEAEGEEAFDEDYRIRCVDFGRFREGDADDRRRFAQEMGEAMEEIGFVVLENTGVDPQLYDDMEAGVQELFTAHDLADKLRFRAERFGSINQGYFPIKETSDIHPDLVEGWVFCRRAFALHEAPDLGAFWPDPALEPRFRAHCLAHEALARPIMSAILDYLGEDPLLYDARLRATNFGLRCNYYPPVTDADAASGAGRLLGHEDVTVFTLLPAPRVEGLQVLNRANFKWVRVQAPPGSLIVNTGDYMQRITNDRLPSTTHRVSKPRDSQALGQARTSFPLNIYLWEDELLEVLPSIENPKYPPIKAVTFHTRTTSKYYGDDYAVER